MITADDALWHDLPALQDARESMMWSHCLAEQGLFINPYVWVDGEGNAGRALILTEQGRDSELMLDIESGLALDRDDPHAFELGGLAVRRPAPMDGAEIRFRNDRCELEYRFTASHAAFDYGSNAGGCPWYMASNRYEQSGGGEGVLRIDGREIRIEGSAHHDHSWGVRDWDAMQHYKWISAQSGTEIGLNLMVTHHRGEQTLNGYVHRDGICAPIVAADLHAEYDEELFACRATAVLTDAAKRSTELGTETYARFTFPVGADAVLLDSAARASIDGRPGVAQLDFLWPTRYVAHLREIAARGPANPATDA